MQAPTLSTRLIWPFTRLMSEYQPELRILQRAGFSRAELVDPDARIPEPIVMELLRASLAKTCDPALGLHAAERVEAGDFGVMEHAARSSASLREALGCCARYMCLLDEGTRATTEERDGTALWQLAPTGTEREPAANDFALLAALRIGQRFTGLRAAPLEIHFVHREPTDAAEYARVFGCPVKLGQPVNAIVMPGAAFDLPLIAANTDLSAAFELQACQQLERLGPPLGVAARVADFVSSQLTTGQASMPAAARRLQMSVPTLRRRLDEEGTSHREIIGRVRHALAVQHLRDGRLAITEIAFLLGFSSVQAFSRAFRRWADSSPAEYRTGCLPAPEPPR